MTITPLDDVIAALAAAPNLPGARCAGRHSLFDLTVEGSACGPVGAAEVGGSEVGTHGFQFRHAAARTEALRLCAGCPELSACAAWVSSLPRSRRPLGVVAGRLYLSPGARSRAKQSKGSAA